MMAPKPNGLISRGTYTRRTLLVVIQGAGGGSGTIGAQRHIENVGRREEVL